VTERTRIGVSACLLGEAVRYDGGGKLDLVVCDELGACFDLVPVCPEAELGLGVPREPISLSGDPARPRLTGQKSGTDLTARMEAWCAARVAQLAADGISGFVLKARSPSCGVRDVPVATDAGEVLGSGLFALALARALPALPVVSDKALHDPAGPAHFKETVLRYRLNAEA